MCSLMSVHFIIGLYENILCQMSRVCEKYVEKTWISMPFDTEL